MKINTYSGKKFTWTRDTGFGEASDLGIGIMAPRKIAIQSHRTGMTKVFELITTMWTMEHEAIAWDYKAQDGFTVRIWND